MPIRNRHGTWHYRVKVNGREYPGSTGLKATDRNREKALVIAEKVREAILSGRWHELQLRTIPFSKAVVDFMMWYRHEHESHPNTARRVEVSFTALRQFFGRKPVSNITAGDVEQFKTWRRTTVLETKSKRGRKPTAPPKDITVRHDLHALSAFFKFAVKNRWARENVVRDVAIPSDADSVRIRILSADEEHRYFEAASSYPLVHDVTRLILLQGLRPDEVVRLRQSDVDFDRKTLTVQRGKTRAARRSLQLTAESLSILARRYHAQSEWVFPGRKPGAHVTKLNSSHWKILEAAKLPRDIVLYSFRHTFATHAAAAGVPIATLAAILGHANIRSVQKYVHPSEEHMRQGMNLYEQYRDKIHPSGKERVQ